MSNLIYAHWRDPKGALDEASLRRIAEAIRPLGAGKCPHHVAEDEGEILGLTGPVGAAVARGVSACLGAFEGHWAEWDKPGSTLPDGTFALIRSDKGRVELCTDFAGSRTLWYALTEKAFFASTSQRALVCLLRDFDLNKSTVSWFLSSGSLGPMDSWDKRISRMPANASLVLDRANWRLDLRAGSIVFRPRPMKPSECREELTRVLRDAIQSYGFEPEGWILPLSGGVDSRCILMMLHEKGWLPRAVTWGLASSATQPGNDAYVARQLAAHYGLQHEYLHTEHPGEDPIQVVDRFLSASGGTTDQLPGYLDGLRIWSSLAERGVKGIIRGDAGFNGEPVHSMPQARASSNLVLLSDFMDEAVVDELSDGRQSLPESLKPGPGESHACYRDRIYHAFRIPVGLAALSDVKAPFVEIASPMLSRRVLEFLREMPDDCRAGRRLYSGLVRDLGPSIPFATMEADDSQGDFLDSPPYVHWLESELSGDLAARLFPESFLRPLLADVRRESPPWKPSRTIRAAVKRIIPSPWIRAARARMGELPEIPGLRQLALRAALICRMVQILEADAAALDGRPA